MMNSSAPPTDDGSGDEASSEGGLEALQQRGWVTLREFCKIAEVTYPTALIWCKTGLIHYTQVGGFKRVYQDEIVHFLRHGTRPGDPEKIKAHRIKRAEYNNNVKRQHAQDAAGAKKRGY